MKGSSQPKLMQAADGNLYVVKFQNNPQGVRILANEWLGAALAALLRLPIPPVAVIEIPHDDPILLSECMYFEFGRSKVPCQPGLCFGMQFRKDGPSWLPHEVTPESIENAEDIIGMVVFDKWTSNGDRRQVAILPNNEGSSYRAVMIDQGFCFGGEQWGFHDGAFQGLSSFNRIYERVIGLHDFEPWLTRLEQEINFEKLRHAAETVPPSWYLFYRDALSELIWQLDQRRAKVRELVRVTLSSAPGLFPNASAAQVKTRTATACASASTKRADRKHSGSSCERGELPARGELIHCSGGEDGPRR